MFLQRLSRFALIVLCVGALGIFAAPAGFPSEVAAGRPYTGPTPTTISVHLSMVQSAPEITVTATVVPSWDYTGQIIQTDQNCGRTEVYGVLHNADGNPLVGVPLRLTSQGGPIIITESGSYVEPWTDASGWTFFLGDYPPVAGTWLVAVIDETGTPLSLDVVAQTEGTCAPGDVNRVKIRFQATQD